MSGTSSPPSPRGIPLLGNAVEFARNPMDALERWNDHGDIVEITLAGQTLHLVTEPDLIEEILVKKSQQFSIGPTQRETFDGVSGLAINSSTGDDWRRRRQAISPPFTGRTVEDYRDGMIEKAVAGVERWDDGDMFDLKREMRLLTVPMLTETLHGINTEDGQQIVMEAADAISGRASFARPGRHLPEWVPTLGDWRFDRKVSALDDYIETVIEEHRQADIENPVCAALLTACDKGVLSEAEVRHNLKGLLIGGNTSPATVLFHVWRMLNEHPSVHETLLEEYNEVVDGDQLSPDDVDELELTEATVKESMRLFPPVIGINREAQNPVTVGEYAFEAGDQFLISQWLPHRDERFWTDAESFDPQRWVEQRDRPQFAYFPFGGGPRVCPGRRVGRQQMTIALATMIGRVSLDCEPRCPMEFKASVTLEATERIEATVSRQ